LIKGGRVLRGKKVVQRGTKQGCIGVEKVIFVKQKETGGDQVWLVKMLIDPRGKTVWVYQDMGGSVLTRGWVSGNGVKFFLLRKCGIVIKREVWYKIHCSLGGGDPVGWEGGRVHSLKQV